MLARLVWQVYGYVGMSDICTNSECGRKSRKTNPFKRV